MVSPLRRQLCLNPVRLTGCGPRLRCAHPWTVRACYASPHSPPAKLDSDKFDDSPADQTGWLDCIMYAGSWGSNPNPAGAPPQTPFRRGFGGGSAQWGVGAGAPSGTWGGAPTAQAPTHPTGYASPLYDHYDLSEMFLRFSGRSNLSAINFVHMHYGLRCFFVFRQKLNKSNVHVERG